jgi:DNA invertase Pin-like site-specific DNA recombinase
VTITIYGRVSTDKQTHDSQLQEVRRYCERLGHSAGNHRHCVRVKRARTGLDQLMALVRKGRVGRGRDLQAGPSRVIFSSPRTTDRGVPNARRRAVCTSQGIDTTNQNPAAQLQLNILCAVAQFEREIIRERVNAGIAAGPVARSQARQALDAPATPGSGRCVDRGRVGRVRYFQEVGDSLVLGA